MTVRFSEEELLFTSVSEQKYSIAFKFKLLLRQLAVAPRAHNGQGHSKLGRN